MLSSPINAQHGAYLLIALAASAMMTAGLLIMKRRADALPVASGARIAHAVGCWISDPVWDAGLAAQSAGFVLYLVALTSLPVSVTAVVMQGGVGLFVLCAVLMLGERARMREWLGIAVTVGAMLLLSASLGGGNSRDVIDVQLTVLVSLAFALAAIIPSMMPTLRHNGVAAAIFAGVAFGLAGLYSKPMADSFLSGSAIEIAARAAINPFVYGVILGNIAGLIALQNSFHDARGIIAMPLSSGISTIVPIIGGMAAFGENLPADTASAALRIGAFVLTIVGAALLAHVHEDEAAEILAGEQSRSA